MYSAKEFYELAGVKRSTVRHYLEQGLLSPADVQENGYAVYGDAQLLDIMLLKNERSLDFSIQEITENRSSSLEQNIGEINRRKAGYIQEIERLQHKVEAIEVYQRILTEMTGTRGKLRVDHKGRHVFEGFWVAPGMQRYPEETPEEIAHCIRAFPFVNIMLRGKRQDVTDPQLERIPMEIGYKYEKGKAHFEPLHPELYETLPALPCVLLRTTTYTPLALDKKLLQPIEEALRREGMRVGGDLYAHIHAVQKTEKGNLFFITARQTAEKIV